jgi:uncharacterized protein (TIGR04255 family)
MLNCSSAFKAMFEWSYDVRYKKNFLNQVILRIDFASLPSLLTERPPEFVSRISDRFPEQRSSRLVQFAVNFSTVPQDPTLAPGVSQVPGSWLWHFGTDKEFKETVALSHNFISLEYGPNKYTSSEEFLDTFKFVHEKLSDVFKIAAVSRIGLRYVNDIKLDNGGALDWAGIIKRNYVEGVLAGL